MTTQVIFKMDKKLKEAAQKKARKEGLSLADLYKFATRSYIDGTLKVGLIYYGTYTPNAKTIRELAKSMRDIKTSKNLSGPFKNGAEMDKYLDNLK
jgi:hypothetical protein